MPITKMVHILHLWLSQCQHLVKREIQEIHLLGKHLKAHL
nr:MAG TPA: signalosome complex subunit [Caudoviricetes sp.]